MLNTSTPLFQYRSDIDGLRAIAILSVVAFHAFPNLIRGGFIGVDIFFVISGYLISSIIYHQLSQNTFTFKDFYARRIRRIFPALIIILIFSIIVGWSILTPQEYQQLGKHIASSAAFLSNFIFWNESGYFDNISDTKPLLHLWSLGLEEQFYILWPFLIWLLWKINTNIFIALFLLIIISFGLNIYFVNIDTTLTFYLPQTRFWELICGSLLALVAFKYPSFCNNLNFKNYLSICGFSLVIGCVIFISKENAFPGWYALIPTIGVVALIFAGSTAWVNKVILSNKVFVWFGLISFPLYLWHWPLLTFARLYYSQTPEKFIIILIILFSIFLSWITYILIEKPVKLFYSKKYVTIILIVLIAFIGAIGLYIFILKGIPGRFPNSLQRINNYRFENPEDTRVGSCFLLPNQNYQDFQDCGISRDKKKKTILIWGDSHASHLIPGYIESFGSEFNIIQRTASGCPPILNLSNNNLDRCNLINNDVYTLIKNESPDVIVLAANWVFYDLKNLDETLDKLKKVHSKDINLIGTVPQWLDSLPKQLHRFYIKNNHSDIPIRMSFGLNENFIKLEPYLKSLAFNNNINFKSAKDIFCNSEGCMTMLNDTLIAWDYAHLTTVGSKYLVSKFHK